ncbi:TIR domain-containing protein [Corallococcus macrosporus]|uniref:TIR domain-containing protein n=1 Tax=Corallococcus macrosporus TaxID=35 RepID=UPI000BB3272C|nr:TIR domain-containing protein [Corallococcus macrosporus]
MLPVFAIVGLGGLLWWATRNGHPSAFISFAAEDAKYRDYLVEQAKRERTPFKFQDRSLHEPFSNAWKTQTREIIKKSDVMIVMIGADTHRAEGALWEIRTAREEGVYVFGVHISKNSKGKIPKELHFCRVVEWSHDGIAEELSRAELYRKRKMARE